CAAFEMNNLTDKIKTDWKNLTNQIIQLLTVLQIGNIFFKLWEYHWLACVPLTEEMFKYILKQHVIFGLWLTVSMILMISLSTFKKYLASLIIGILILTVVSFRLWTF
ncbi:hypothetical protein, partial [Psychroflexus aurantiacus]|uniref:hypothetical protein n=1 Tax=Psychroflexus aurantiacus TaxID=2709310 RepID=UPI0019683EDE